MGSTPAFCNDVSHPAELASPAKTAPFALVASQYPRIAESIDSLWGKRELDAYFDQLVLKDRDERNGFPPTVLEALLILSAEHVRRFQFEPLDCYDDVWDPFVKHAHRH